MYKKGHKCILYCWQSLNLGAISRVFDRYQWVARKSVESFYIDTWSCWFQSLESDNIWLVDRAFIFRSVAGKLVIYSHFSPIEAVDEIPWKTCLGSHAQLIYCHPVWLNIIPLFSLVVFLFMHSILSLRIFFSTDVPMGWENMWQMQDCKKPVYCVHKLRSMASKQWRKVTFGLTKNDKVVAGKKVYTWCVIKRFLNIPNKLNWKVQVSQK